MTICGHITNRSSGSSEWPGECGPYAPEQYELPMPPHRMNWHAQVLARGARAVGAHSLRPADCHQFDGLRRPPGVHLLRMVRLRLSDRRKATAANAYLAKAERLGVRVMSEAFVHRVEYDATSGRVSGVSYLDAEKREHGITAGRVDRRRPRTRNAANPFALGKSDIPRWPGEFQRLVGRYLMSHPTWQVFGTFDEPINAFKGMQMGHVMVHDFYRPRQRQPNRDYARGFILLSYMMTPITYANLSGSFYGPEYKRFLHDYSPTRPPGGAHAEGLPQADNRITLDPDVTTPAGCRWAG